MIFSQRLLDEPFIGETVKDLPSILYSLNRNIPVFNIYLIISCSNSNNIFEIISSFEFVKKRYHQKDFKIIGIAGGKYEAYDIIRHILQIACDKNIQINDILSAIENGDLWWMQ